MNYNQKIKHKNEIFTKNKFHEILEPHLRANKRYEFVVNKIERFIYSVRQRIEI